MARHASAGLAVANSSECNAVNVACGLAQRERLRVRITAPPVDGKANKHLLAWLAEQFGVGKASVTIETGQSSPLKRVRVKNPGRLPDIISPPRTS